MDPVLKKLLGGVFGLPTAEIRTSLKQSEVDSWESLKQMDLVVSLETAYDISLEITDIVRMTSVLEIIAVLTEKGVIFDC
jgi:acyl carrier protein